MSLLISTRKKMHWKVSLNSWQQYKTWQKEVVAKQRWFDQILHQKNEQLQNGIEQPNLTFFDILHKRYPKERKIAVLLKLLVKNHSINWATSTQTSENLKMINYVLPEVLFSLCRPMTLEKQTTKLFPAFLEWTEDLDATKFQRVRLTNPPTNTDQSKTKIFPWDKNILSGNLVEELARRSMEI